VIYAKILVSTMKKRKKSTPRAKDKATKLALAQRHLERVQAAWDDPVDWDDLSLYGFYCLEAAVEAAALHFGMQTTHIHAEKADIAFTLHEQYGLPDVSDLLVELNGARKAVAYGDVEPPELDPADVASEIEEFVQAVATLLAEGKASASE
jgi:hypothetical protein